MLCIPISKFILFGDDTNILLSHNDPNELFHLANCELDKISVRFKANILSLNH